MSFSKPDVLRTAMKRAWNQSRLKTSRQRARGVASHAHSFHAEQLSVLRSDVDVTSAEFKDNAAAMNDRIEQLRELRATITRGGGAKASEKHVARGKMLVREYAPDISIIDTSDSAPAGSLR
jgi:3-methylcrotonyl-CoA carboxylase beta subunit